jgi:hypothetical protein
LGGLLPFLLATGPHSHAPQNPATHKDAYWTRQRCAEPRLLRNTTDITGVDSSKPKRWVCLGLGAGIATGAVSRGCQQGGYSRVLQRQVVGLISTMAVMLHSCGGCLLRIDRLISTTHSLWSPDSLLHVCVYVDVFGCCRGHTVTSKPSVYHKADSGGPTQKLHTGNPHVTAACPPTWHTFKAQLRHLLHQSSDHPRDQATIPKGQKGTWRLCMGVGT